MQQRPHHVLLAEDDTALASMLGDLFTEEGYAVGVAHDGQRALHLGLTREYDVVVLDRGLPAIDGLHVLGRRPSKRVRTPVLVRRKLGREVVDTVHGLGYRLGRP